MVSELPLSGLGMLGPPLVGVLLYNDAITRGHDHPHAVRILARAWLYLIWRCWQDPVAYDPAKHKALQALLTEPQHTAT